VPNKGWEGKGSTNKLFLKTDEMSVREVMSDLKEAGVLWKVWWDLMLKKR